MPPNPTYIISSYAIKKTKSLETKVVKEYCQAITQMTGQLCCD
jgi:hypothetical protein